MSESSYEKMAGGGASAERIQEAYLQCTRQASAHYENFPVGSCLLPAEKRRHIHAVYAFARTADDFADETVDSLSVPERLALLDRWEQELMDAAGDGPLSQPLFLAVREAIRSCDLSVQLFRDLLSAFKQDVTHGPYETFADVLDYCRRSADPVGRLVLEIFGYRDPSMLIMSDRICTGLQLANFWQDLSVDIPRGRHYIPDEDLADYGIPRDLLPLPSQRQAARDLIAFQVKRTQSIFDEGRDLPLLLDRGLETEIKFTWLGGVEILNKIRRVDYQTLHFRPKLKKWEFGWLLFRAIFEPW